MINTKCLADIKEASAVLLLLPDLKPLTALVICSTVIQLVCISLTKYLKVSNIFSNIKSSQYTL